ncbi:DUF6572 domain-containing protein [Bacterioplanoides sp.]|uniref:DUF6572 domain-containing protein n=1 Tax=Bacterioplanoides sp. TaxID=2066072 RepID=UPI003B5B8B4A
MTIEQLEVIDILGFDEMSATLVISDHLEWDQENEKLLLIQEKINKYLTFIKSGELLEKYPEAEGKEVEIQLVSRYVPNNELAEHFLNKVSEIISEAGFQFRHEIKEKTNKTS